MPAPKEPKAAKLNRTGKARSAMAFHLTKAMSDGSKVRASSTTSVFEGWITHRTTNPDLLVKGDAAGNAQRSTLHFVLHNGLEFDLNDIQHLTINDGQEEVGLR